MELTLRRFDGTPTRTLGRLFLGDETFCWTLEDPVRVDDPVTPVNEGAKIAGRTAIPAGRYRMTLTMSIRFKTVLPLLHQVPGFEGIRIHAGNTAEDTAGCILVGFAKERDALINSRAALSALLSRLGVDQEHWITIVNPDSWPLVA